MARKANLKKGVKGPMKMKSGSFLESNKELKFGGVKKYVRGGNPESKNQDLLSYLTAREKLTISDPTEKIRIATERRNKAQNNREESSGNNTNASKANTTSGYPNVGRPAVQGGNYRRNMPSASTRPPTQLDSKAPKRSGELGETEGQKRITTEKKAAKKEFKSAFAEARRRGKTTFTLNGKTYSTRQKGESSEQHSSAMKSSGPQAMTSRTVSRVESNAPKAQLQQTRTTVPVPEDKTKLKDRRAAKRKATKSSTSSSKPKVMSKVSTPKPKVMSKTSTSRPKQETASASSKYSKPKAATPPTKYSK